MSTNAEFEFSRNCLVVGADEKLDLRQTSGLEPVLDRDKLGRGQRRRARVLDETQGRRLAGCLEEGQQFAHHLLSRGHTRYPLHDRNGGQDQTLFGVHEQIDQRGGSLQIARSQVFQSLLLLSDVDLSLVLREKAQEVSEALTKEGGEGGERKRVKQRIGWWRGVGCGDESLRASG